MKAQKQTREAEAWERAADWLRRRNVIKWANGRVRLSRQWWGHRRPANGHRRRKGMTAATGCLASLAQIQIHTCTNTQIQILKYKFSNRQQKKPTITGWGRAPLCPENPSPIKRQLERQRQWQWQRQIQKQSPGRKGRASATGCLGQPVGSTLTPEPLH